MWSQIAHDRYRDGRYRVVPIQPSPPDVPHLVPTQRLSRLFLRLALILGAGSAGFAVLAMQVLPVLGRVPAAVSYEQGSAVALAELAEGSTVLDMNGSPIGELVGAENRVVIPLDAVSPQMRKTVIAVEDADFYDHHGVSFRSVLRAFQANSDSGSISQGGSTITQQLIKLSIVGSEQTMSRKLREASLALQFEDQICRDVERVECKDRILGQYLNTVYLGRGAYGVEAGARLYFDKPASALGWTEAALLTALIRNPNGYDPIRHPDVARKRRAVVAGRLADEGIIDEAEAELIDLAPLPRQVFSLGFARSGRQLSYFERHVRDELLDAEWLAPTREMRKFLIFNGGLTITSTFDPRAQFLAEVASASNPIARANPDSVAVVAAVEPASGAVRAVVGERHLDDGRVVELAEPAVGRSPGSAFKTFTLAAALEEGYKLRDSISAAPAPRSLVKGWGIRSSTWPAGCHGGTVTLARAISSSNNCAFARLQAAVGGEKVVDVAQRLGIDTVDDASADIPSLTLGGVAVRPLEMAGAYAAIANDGIFNRPHFVTKVVDREGKVLYQHRPSRQHAISSDVAAELTEGLRAVVTGGTYSGGRLSDRRQAAGKTGTNEAENWGNADVWFVGFTPQIATAVWIGDPAGQIRLRGGRIQGGNTAGKVWFNFMEPYHDGLPVIDFPEAPRHTTRSQYIEDPWRNLKGQVTSTRSRTSTRSNTTTTVEVANTGAVDDGGEAATTTTVGAPVTTTTTPPPTTTQAPPTTAADPADE